MIHAINSDTTMATLNDAEESALHLLLDELRSKLGSDVASTDALDLAGVETGWRYGKGKAAALVRPRTAEDVAFIVERAQASDVRVHTIGGNTGLVGASNPDTSGEQLVISLERLNTRIDIDPVDQTVVVDAGVRLSELNAALEPHGLEFPIDLGADPQIGGMIATNTGGARLLEYGDVRQNLLGLEVVLPSGERVDQLKSLRKDNTGLDFKQLFVGTSGAYGIITRAVLEVAQRPKQRTAALAALESGEAALELLAFLEANAGGTLTAFEVISAPALEVTLQHGANLRDPFPGATPAYAALIELTTTLGREHLDLDALLEALLGTFVESDAGEGLLDAAVGQSSDFWNIRHQISESLAASGRVLALDMSVPRSKMAAFARAANELIAARYPFVRACDFGHWGDGGTHFNLVWQPGAALDGVPVDDAALAADLQRRLYDLCVLEFGGSFSAEHGIGPHNRAHAERLRHPCVADTEVQLREHFDPRGLLRRKE